MSVLDSNGQVLCDPCKITPRGSTVACNWVGKSLSPHLKAHKRAGGKVWTMADYKKKFPNANVGAPSYSPSPEHVAKLRAGKEAASGETAPPDPETVNERDEKIRAQTEILWNLCERDPAARVICEAVARDGLLIHESYDRADELRRQENWPALKAVNQEIEAVNKRLLANQESLGVTAEQRRKNNQIGSDTLTQLVSNYENTLRKMAPARRDAFLRKFETWQAQAQARVKANIIDAVEDQFDAEGTVVDASDFRSAILKFGKRM